LKPAGDPASAGQENYRWFTIVPVEGPVEKKPSVRKEEPVVLHGSGAPDTQRSGCKVTLPPENVQRRANRGCAYAGWGSARFFDPGVAWSTGFRPDSIPQTLQSLGNPWRAEFAAALQLAEQFQAIGGDSLVPFRLGGLPYRVPARGEIRIDQSIFGRGGVNQGEKKPGFHVDLRSINRYLVHCSRLAGGPGRRPRSGAGPNGCAIARSIELPPLGFEVFLSFPPIHLPDEHGLRRSRQRQYGDISVTFR